MSGSTAERLCVCLEGRKAPMIFAQSMRPSGSGALREANMPLTRNLSFGGERGGCFGC
jgi:hypothetical protein